VQSVALRLICEREAEIRTFVSEEYWTITAHLSKQKQRKVFEAQLFALLNAEGEAEEPQPQLDEGDEGRNGAPKNGNGKKGRSANGDEPERTRIKIGSEEEAKAILAELEGAMYRVRGVEQKDVRRQPWLPYTTSTMQQDASVRLRFAPKKTMSLAQQLYEGLELGARGHQGLITYMRTDSTRVSGEAQQAVKKLIKERFGEDYVGEGRAGKSKATVQDAHEAIRPTDVALTPDMVKAYLTPDLFKLYQLIWRRFVAAFMAAAVFDTVRVDITAAKYLFRANGSNLKFAGFYAVWPREEDEEALPPLEVGEPLDLHQLKPDQHFTQPPPRYGEASLIKELEERGIGRPSTYVPIVSTIQERGYVEQQERRFVPTWLGETVNEVMTNHFPDIVDVGFTVAMEQKLDSIEEGQQEWTEFLRRFYDEFKETLARAESEMPKVQKPVEEIGELCPECGRPLVIRSGRFGPFISCSGFPECAFKKKLVNKTGALCPQCGGDLVVRKTKKRGKVFYGCMNYPTCNFAIWDRPVATPCPNCGGLVTVAQGKQVASCTMCGTVIEGIAQEGGAEGSPAGQNGRFPSRSGARAPASGGGTGTWRSAGRAGRTTKRGTTRKTSTRKSSAGTKTAAGAAKKTTAKPAAKAKTTAAPARRTRATTKKETIALS
jgi:DNA topoisomerase-1